MKTQLAVVTVVATTMVAGSMMVGCGSAGAETNAAPTRVLTEQHIHDAQRAWGDAIVRIGAVHTEGGDYRAAANEVLNTMYSFGHGPVLFKPTVASNPQFRPDHDSALSYFVTGSIGEDKGFALAPWTNVRFENAALHLHGDIALAMGNYFFTNADGEEIKVEYGKAYLLDEDGNVRILMQHSSLPFVPDEKERDDRDDVIDDLLD